ncbi:MAG: hypothetical protein HOQ22_05035 [Nocardioidaceae bacterium]|nr:hypothetical protein [Nocardioidaceae bacterium]NUS50391.1 hypothetical protein [Nocardioidaceae bacterium]
MGRSREPGRRGGARTRQRVWHACLRVALVVGLACALVEWGLWGPVATAFAIMVPAFSVAVLAGVKGIWRSIKISVEVGLGLVACVALIAAFGWSGVIVVVALVVTSPVVHALLVTGRLWPGPGQPVRWDVTSLIDDGGPGEERRGPPPDPRLPTRTAVVSLTELPGAEGLTTLDDQALCRAWRRSYLQLEARAGESGRLEVVRLRQLYLDELARRHPIEVRRWLASGARAAGNPMPFLERPPTGSDDADLPDDPWPELE